ncbi:hypothetical protein OSTOST_10297 [Ostertagia ostertagi]
MRIKKKPPFQRELSILKELKNANAMRCPRLVDSGRICERSFIVMTLLDRNLEKLKENLRGFFRPTSVYHLAAEALSAIEDVHVLGYVHRDIKPTNFCVGLQMAAVRVFLIDFGEAVKTGKNIKFATPDAYTLPYMAIDAHKRAPAKPKMDLEAWFYTFSEMLYPQLLTWKQSYNEAEILAAKTKFWSDLSVSLTACAPQIIEAAKIISAITDRIDYNGLRKLMDDARNSLLKGAPLTLEWVKEMPKVMPKRGEPIAVQHDLADDMKSARELKSTRESRSTRQLKSTSDTRSTREAKSTRSVRQKKGTAQQQPQPGHEKVSYVDELRKSLTTSLIQRFRFRPKKKKLAAMIASSDTGSAESGSTEPVASDTVSVEPDMKMGDKAQPTPEKKGKDEAKESLFRKRIIRIGLSKKPPPIASTESATTDKSPEPSKATEQAAAQPAAPSANGASSAATTSAGSAEQSQAQTEGSTGSTQPSPSKDQEGTLFQRLSMRVLKKKKGASKPAEEKTIQTVEEKGPPSAETIPSKPSEPSTVPQVEQKAEEKKADTTPQTGEEAKADKRLQLLGKLKRYKKKATTGAEASPSAPTCEAPAPPQPQTDSTPATSTTAPSDVEERSIRKLLRRFLPKKKKDTAGTEQKAAEQGASAGEQGAKKVEGQNEPAPDQKETGKAKEGTAAEPSEAKTKEVDAKTVESADKKGPSDVEEKSVRKLLRRMLSRKKTVTVGSEQKGSDRGTSAGEQKDSTAPAGDQKETVKAKEKTVADSSEAKTKEIDAKATEGDEKKGTSTSEKGASADKKGKDGSLPKTTEAKESSSTEPKTEEAASTEKKNKEEAAVSTPPPEKKSGETAAKKEEPKPPEQPVIPMKSKIRALWMRFRGKE